MTAVGTLEVVDLDVDWAAVPVCEEERFGVDCTRTAAWLLLGVCSGGIEHRALMCRDHRRFWLQRIAAGGRVVCTVHGGDATIRWVAL